LFQVESGQCVSHVFIKAAASIVGSVPLNPWKLFLECQAFLLTGGWCVCGVRQWQTWPPSTACPGRVEFPCIMDKWHLNIDISRQPHQSLSAEFIKLSCWLGSPTLGCFVFVFVLFCFLILTYFLFWYSKCLRAT
jgi:hypothetical protein